MSSDDESAFEEMIRPGKVSSRIKVAVRIRPLIKRETKAREVVTTEVQHNGTQIAIEEKGLKVFNRRMSRRDLGLSGVAQDNRMRFTYDKVFDQDSTQEAVFNSSARPIVDQVVAGYHGCIFAYGQTSSGKTHTMLGTPDNPGVTYRAAERLHQMIKRKQKKFSAEVDVQYLEIYNETLIDLLLPRGSQPDEGMRLREDPVHGIFVENATTRKMSHVRDLIKYIEEGTSRRTTAATKMNEVSSRSHAVLTITVRQQEIDDDDGFTRMESRLHLIDLAGSERLHDTGAVGQQLKEGALINQSLTALGIVIKALVDKGKHVPYRNSKLTRLLQDSLGGNSLTLVMANVSPASGSYSETLSTLRFADRAKKIKNKPVQNVDPMVKRIKELQDEIRRLEELSTYCQHCNSETGVPHTHAHGKKGCGAGGAGGTGGAGGAGAQAAAAAAVAAHKGDLSELVEKSDRFEVVRELLKGQYGERVDDVVHAIQEILLEKERRGAEDQLKKLAERLKQPALPDNPEKAIKSKLPPGVLDKLVAGGQGGGKEWIDANHMFFYMTALACKMTAKPDCPGRRIPTPLLYKEAMEQKVPWQYYRQWLSYQVNNLRIVRPKERPPVSAAKRPAAAAGGAGGPSAGPSG